MIDREICEQARLSKDKRFDGKFFTAVLTTGIFCRPICPARTPKSENVEYYPSQEAALHAGFRPCKRCIPEFSPPLLKPAEIKKALNTHGAEALSVEQLADICSLSTRQLQRIFNEHYGLSPKQYFIQKRLLFAKQLLANSDLPITDIAFASGFNSVRRFNEVIKQSFKATPSEIRKVDKQITADSFTLQLHYQGDLDWPLMLSFFRNRQIPGLEHITDSSYHRAVKLDDCSGWFTVSQENKKYLTLTAQLSDYRYLQQLVLRVRKMFDLDVNLDMVHQRLSDTPQLASVIQHFPGLRLPGSWDTFEFSIRAILGQQISVKAATTLAKRIAETYGTRIDKEEQYCSLSFPTIEQLINADFEGIGLTKTRVQTLKNWIAYYAENQDLFEQYPSIDSLEKQLCAIKGIGPWTVNYIAMRGLSEPDAFPAADLGIIKALSPPDKKLSVKEITAKAEHWRPWRAYAALYLWQSHSMKEN